MHSADHHDEKELASFIRDGMKRRPEQAFGDYYRGVDASCALGAAYDRALVRASQARERL